MAGREVRSWCALKSRHARMQVGMNAHLSPYWAGGGRIFKTLCSNSTYSPKIDGTFSGRNLRVLLMLLQFLKSIVMKILSMLPRQPQFCSSVQLSVCFTEHFRFVPVIMQRDRLGEITRYLSPRHELIIIYSCTLHTAARSTTLSGENDQALPPFYSTDSPSSVSYGYVLYCARIESLCRKV